MEQSNPDKKIQKLRTENRELRERISALEKVFDPESAFGQPGEHWADESSRTNTEFLELAQRLSRVGYWFWNWESGIISWSDEVYRIYERDSGKGAPSNAEYLDYQHPEDKEALQISIRKALEEKNEYRLEHRIISESGKVKHVSSIGRVFYHKEGQAKGLFGTIQDISELKRTQEALASKEAMLRAMAEASYDALIMIDCRDHIIYWSPAAEKMFGWSREEALGKKLHPLIAPEEYHQQAQLGLKEFGHSGSGPVLNAILEFTAVDKNGEIFPVERSVASFQSEGEFFAVGSLRDITKRKAAEQELRSQAERLALASEAGGIGIWELNADTGELTWDKRMYELYAVDPDRFSGLYEAWKNRVHPEDIEEAARELNKALHAASDWHWEFRILLPGGIVRHIQAAARTHREENGRTLRMIGINQDITEAKESRQRLKHLATTDNLTGIYNRGYFLELFEGEIDRSLRYSRPLSLIIFDIDRFKSINDTYGHDMGDRVLRDITGVILAELRKADIFGRIGGEEFAVVFPETGLNAALPAAERLRKAVGESLLPLEADKRLNVTISLGIAELDAVRKNGEALLKAADEALYQAKNQGRNRVVHA